MLHEDDGLAFETQEERDYCAVITQAWRIRQRQICEENSQNPVAMRNRLDSEREAWVRSLESARQEHMLIAALNKIFAKAKNLSGYGISGYTFPRKDWRRAQSLAVVAIVFYQKRAEDPEKTEDAE